MWLKQSPPWRLLLEGGNFVLLGVIKENEPAASCIQTREGTFGLVSPINRSVGTDETVYLLACYDDHTQACLSLST